MRARYVSELVAHRAPTARRCAARGTLDGPDRPTRRAAASGFGYDPVFVPDGEELTVAELGDGWKDRNSHRARAARALLAALGALPAPRSVGLRRRQRRHDEARARARSSRTARGRARSARGSRTFPARLKCSVAVGGKPVQATCATDVSLVKPTRAVVTLTEAWNHGANAHTWFFFIRRNGEIESVVQEGAAAP